MPDKPMKRKIDAARSRGAWLYLAARDLWVTPDELEEAQKRDDLLWVAQNWQVVPISVRHRQLTEAVARAKRELRDFERKTEGTSQAIDCQ